MELYKPTDSGHLRTEVITIGFLTKLMMDKVKGAEIYMGRLASTSWLKWTHKVARDFILMYLLENWFPTLSSTETM
jgi:hypothetical protein